MEKIIAPMPNPAHGSFAALQIRSHKDKIKIVWENRVRAKVAVAGGQTSLALQNSMGTFLDQLAALLEESVIPSLDGPGEEGMARHHGAQRATFQGYFLPQLLKEFSILREVLMETLHETDSLTYKVGAIVNAAFDNAISLASTEFALVQQTAVSTALQRAEDSNKNLENFAAIAAHDLKSPLATISGYLDLLQEELQKNQNLPALQFIEIMQNASARMLDLIDRLLEYARLGKTQRSFTLIDLTEILTSVLQNLHESTTRIKARIVAGPLPKVKGDVHLLTQLFQNLLANSIKFASDQPLEIRIDSTIKKSEFLFTFRDNGIGFDNRERETIFDLYKKIRVDEKYEGAGIGLATCKKVVELHGGRIWAESIPGQGATFYFTLPIPREND